jgi:potassium-transporting ATPase potassium-binding subunit
LFDALMIVLIADSLGTLPTTATVRIGLLLGVIVGGLTYLPALALGPVAEHFAMLRGTAY